MLASASDTHQRYYLLDGIRGLAAIFVVQRHAPEFFGFSPLPSSHLAVDIFFVMSGFVLAGAYQERLSTSMSWAGFMGRRIIRLYPMYLLGTLLMTAILLIEYGLRITGLSPSILMLGLAVNLLFLPTPRVLSWNGSNPFIDNPAWSLFHELVANGIYALIARHLTRTVLIAIIVGSAIALTASSYKNGTVDVGYMTSNFIYGIPRVMFSFFMGILIFRIRHVLPGFGISIGLVCLAAICAAMAIEIKPKVPYELAVVLFIFPIAILLASRVRLPGWAEIACKYLGASSYPLYLLHGPGIHYTKLALSAAGVSYAGLTPFIGLEFVIGMVILAVAVEKSADEPVRAWLSQAFARRKSSGRPIFRSADRIS